jgi:hypothetical protein
MPTKIIIPGEIPDGYDTQIDAFPWNAYFLACMAGWFLLSIAARTIFPKPGKEEDFKKRGEHHDYKFFLSEYVSLAHAFYALSFDIFILTCTDSEANKPCNFWHYFVLYASTAYFLVDEIMETIDGTSDFLTHLHHAAVLFGGANHMMDYYSGHEFHLMLIVAEISNPFLITRTMLKIVKKDSGLIFDIAEYGFAVSFLFCRSILTHWLVYRIYEGDNVIVTSKVCVSFVNFIQ